MLAVEHTVALALEQHDLGVVEDAVEQGGDGLTVLRVEALDGLELKAEARSAAAHLHHCTEDNPMATKDKRPVSQQETNDTGQAERPGA